MTKEERARKALQVWLDDHFTQDEQDDIAFYPDVQEEDSYTWRFKSPYGLKIIHLTYFYKTKEIVKIISDEQ